MKRIIKTLALIGIAVALVYYFRTPLGDLLSRFENKILPCGQPIEYSIGRFDDRFGMSKEEFSKAIADAEQIWEKAAGKQLFVLSDNGGLRINLIYDDRQKVTDILQNLGLAVKENRASYEALKTEYETLTAKYGEEKILFETKLQIFNKDKSSYDAEVELFNKRGRTQKADYDRLNAERALLEQRAEELKRENAALNGSVETINILAVKLNRLAQTLNISVTRVNEFGVETGEFEEGAYISNATGQSIDIYQFDNRQKLVRVLAHELGHALGLQHVPDPKSIMYRVNDGLNEKTTTDDLAELKEKCNLK